MPPKSIKGFIHPRDPRPASKSKSTSNSRCWSRLKDCFTGQGPDIFVGIINRPRTNHHHHRSTRLKRDAWSNWDSLTHPSYEGFDGQRGQVRVYNFRTRKYENWRGEELEDGGLWSDVAYCADERHWDPVMVRDAWGNVFDTREWVGSEHCGRAGMLL